MGFDKLSAELCGKSVLRRTLEALRAFAPVGGAMVVCRPGDAQVMAARIAQWDLSSFARMVEEGGETRQQSVLHGLRAMPCADGDIVLIHDAARPFVDQATIRACCESALAFGSGVAGCAATDTLHIVEDGRMALALDRSRVMAVQTPQAFSYRRILDAYEAAGRAHFSATDDASVAAFHGLEVRIVQASADNVKLTNASDFARAEALLRPSALRVGFGYDAHRLVAGRALVLGGVRIPHDMGLLGHSDADVLTHAVMDALLGACALGDIGQHFPDREERFRGASSLGLLAQVREILAEAGFAPVNVDATLVAQAPRIAPFREAMRANLADALRLPLERVNVKATTTEGMGFEGRGEGMSASAVAQVAR